MSLKLTNLPTEILYLIIFSIDDAKDLRSLSSTNRLLRALSGPHTITANLWFKRYSCDIPPENLLKIANEWKFPLETDFAKNLITINAPPEPPGLSADPPGPKRALRRQERVLHIVERFSLFLHNMLAVNYYYNHDWDALQKVADDVEQYLEDLGWVQFYRGQMDRGIDSIMVSTVQADQEFEAVAFEDFTRKLRTDIAAVSSITTSSSSKSSVIPNNNDSRNDSRNDSIDNIYDGIIRIFDDNSVNTDTDTIDDTIADAVDGEDESYTNNNDYNYDSDSNNSNDNGSSNNNTTDITNNIITTSSSSDSNSNNVLNSNRSSEIFASLAPEPVYLRWTSLIQDQLNFFCLQQYIMDKFKPPSKWQLAEYLSVVLFGNI